MLVGSMSKELEGVKKKRRFMRKSVTDSLKLIDEALAEENSHARVQVLKDNILSKWNDLQRYRPRFLYIWKTVKLTMNVQHTMSMK